MKIHQHAIWLCLAALLSACGGGSNSPTPIASVLTGVFVDSPVIGIGYATATQSGKTNAKGEFSYVAGENVTFSIGSVQLPVVAANATVTPLDIAKTTDLNNQVVSNILVLLQSLDEDGNPANGIAIPTAAAAKATTSINFDMSPTAFAANSAVTDLVGNSGSVTKTLVAEATAKAHFQGTLSGSPVTIKVNVAPVANAGAGQSVLTTTVVILDGGTSSDANNDTLTYDWTLTTKPAGSSAVLTAATSAKPTFTADVAGNYTASLVVNDGIVSSTASPVTVTASAANAAPVANAGVAQSVLAASTVMLNGAASSDANGDTLTYAWTLTSKPAGSSAVLNSATTVNPTFVADKAGNYVAGLTVSDGKLNSTTVTITVTAAVANVAPVANAGVYQNVVAGSVVTFDGSASSDANNNLLTYAWTLTSKPAGSAAALASATSAKPTLTADVAGTYVATLVVNDGKLSSAAVTITVTAETNIPFMPTPSVVATPITNSTPFDNEYWKIEYTGTDAGFCDALYVNQYGNSYTEGMCLSRGKVLEDFRLSGIVDSNGTATLNTRVNESLLVGPIFRGTLRLDGLGTGTWSIPNSTAQGAWTATRYSGKKIYSVPSLNNPQAGSFASGTDPIHGIWKRPTITNFPEFALILPNGETAWQVTSPFGGFARMFGTFVGQDSTWSLGNGSALYSSSSIQNVNASGTFIPRTQIVGTMSASTGNPVTLSFDSYSIENALALTLQDISGTYIGGGSTYIGTDGTVIGSTEQGCKVRGKISEIFPGAKLNLFHAKITFYGPSSNPARCVQTQSGPDYDGYIFIQVSGSERYLYSLLKPSLISIGSNPTIGMYSAYVVGSQIR